MSIDSVKFGAIIFKSQENSPNQIADLATMLNRAISSRRGFYQHRDNRWIQQLGNGEVRTFPACDLVVTLEPNATQPGRVDLQPKLFTKCENPTQIPSERLSAIFNTLPSTINLSTQFKNPLNYFIQVIRGRLRHSRFNKLRPKNTDSTTSNSVSTTSSSQTSNNQTFSREIPKIRLTPLFERARRRRKE